MNRTVRNLALAGLIAVAAAMPTGNTMAQENAGGAFIDNERVSVFDQKPSKAELDRLAAMGKGIVTVSLDRDTLGSVTFRAKAAPAPAASAVEWARAIVIALKDHRVEPMANKSGHNDAFDRPGIKKVLDNAQVTIWDYTWTFGQATPMHFHDKDVVVVWLENGGLKSTLPDGSNVVNEHQFGVPKFNRRDRVHTETLVKGNARAVIVELK